MSTAAKAFLTETQSARMGRILDATRQLLTTVGADRMTMRDIAAAGGVSAATLYNRFGTKDKLITLAVVDYFERSIHAVINAHATAGTPLQKIVYGLQVLTDEILRSRMFAHALMGAFFKLDSDRQMPEQLLAAVHGTSQPIIEEMQKQRFLCDWTSVTQLVEETSDRIFSVVMRWAQQGFPDAELSNRLIFSSVTVLMAASRGKQAAEAEQILIGLHKQPKKRVQKVAQKG